MRTQLQEQGGRSSQGSCHQGCWQGCAIVPVTVALDVPRTMSLTNYEALQIYLIWHWPANPSAATFSKGILWKYVWMPKYKVILEHEPEAP